MDECGFVVDDEPRCHGYAWLYGRDDRSVGGANHVVVTTDGSTWTRFALPH
ncbi:hypothetical protein EV384_0680 [Micromonospora kangleipakensis]|uniref:Uncharacterized protein n=1 Tax=Micromonospora kangleipakensis TaxID=1077942 RepID=A0A4Q8B5L2_9ACTN|nr:hypothetical protein EV384_0680 [Micromonospora kangleipakensis]